MASLNPPRLNIEDLYDKKKEADEEKAKHYNMILERIHKTIKVTSYQRDQNQWCYYTFQPIMLNYPRYNLNECLIYCISCLEQDGFKVKFFHPNLILISWRHWVPSYVREQIKLKTGVSVDKFGNRIEETNQPKHITQVSRPGVSKSVSFKSDDDDIFAIPSTSTSTSNNDNTNGSIYGSDRIDSVLNNIR